MQPPRVDFAIDRPVGVRHEFSDLRHDVPPHIDIEVRVHLLEILLKVLHAQLVPILVLAIVLRELLHSVIRQVNELVVDIVDVEFFAARPDVGILIEVAFQVTVYRTHESITSKVEFPSIDEQRVVDVSLDNEG